MKVLRAKEKTHNKIQCWKDSFFAKVKPDDTCGAEICSTLF